MTNISVEAFCYERYEIGPYYYDEEEDEWYRRSSVANLQSATIPASVVSISSWAFERCTNLVSVSIGNTGILIDGSAFRGCKKLVIDIEKPGFKLVGWDLFREKNPKRLVGWHWDDASHSWVDEYEEYVPDFMPVGTTVRIDSIEPLIYGMPTDKLETNLVWNAEKGINEEIVSIVTNHLSGVWATPAWEIMTLWDSAAGSDPFTGAATEVYDGFILDKNSGLITGTIQVKTSKAKNGTAKANVVIQLADGTTMRFSGNIDIATGKLEANGLSLTVNANGISGSYNDYLVDGTKNGFMSKDKAVKDAAAALLQKWIGVYSVAWENDAGCWNGLTLTVAAKGKVKIAGTMADGTKVNGKAQLLIGGGDTCAIPVIVTKKASIAANVWLGVGGLDVVGLNGAVAGKATTALDAGLALRFDAAAFGAALGDTTYSAYLPVNMPVAQNGAKWDVAGGAKPGKVQLRKGATAATDVDNTKTGANPAALKFNYKAKDGTFKGSFKAYTLEKGKPKNVKVDVVGVTVDGKAYGTLSVKKPTVSLPATIK